MNRLQLAAVLETRYDPTAYDFMPPAVIDSLLRELGLSDGDAGAIMGCDYLTVQLLRKHGFQSQGCWACIMERELRKMLRYLYQMWGSSALVDVGIMGVD